MQQVIYCLEVVKSQNYLTWDFETFKKNFVYILSYTYQLLTYLFKIADFMTDQ